MVYDVYVCPTGDEIYLENLVVIKFKHLTCNIFHIFLLV
jgi:hypothetical protein